MTTVQDVIAAFDAAQKLMDEKRQIDLRLVRGLQYWIWQHPGTNYSGWAYLMGIDVEEFTAVMEERQPPSDHFWGRVKLYFEGRK